MSPISRPHRKPELLHVRTKGDQHKSQEENSLVSGLNDRRCLSVTTDGDTKIAGGWATDNVVAAPQRRVTECATAGQGPLDPPYNPMGSIPTMKLMEIQNPPPLHSELKCQAARKGPGGTRDGGPGVNPAYLKASPTTRADHLRYVSWGEILLDNFRAIFKSTDCF